MSINRGMDKEDVVHGEGRGNTLQCSCLGNPMDREAWQATVHGVARSWTRLKRLSTRVHTPSEAIIFDQRMGCFRIFTLVNSASVTIGVSVFFLN